MGPLLLLVRDQAAGIRASLLPQTACCAEAGTQHIVTVSGHKPASVNMLSVLPRPHAVTMLLCIEAPCGFSRSGAWCLMHDIGCTTEIWRVLGKCTTRLAIWLPARFATAASLDCTTKFVCGLFGLLNELQ